MTDTRTISIKPCHKKDWETFQKRHPSGVSPAIMRLIRIDNAKAIEDPKEDAS